MKDFLKIIFDKKSFSKLFAKDWVAKFLSLVLALMLWYYVGGEDLVDKNVMVPVEIINLPRDLVISNQFKKEIEVTVSGPRSIILEMANKAVTRQVDLSAATPGSMVIENDVDHIPVPRGITVQRVQPSSVILSLDKLIQKKFPVSAKTVGKVADGFLVRTLRTEPDVITITGPQTALSQFDELFTRAIDLTNVKQSAQFQVPLELEPAIVELIGETSVTADLTVGLETITQTIRNLKVHAVIEGVTQEVDPPFVNVTARVPKILLTQNLEPRDILSATGLLKEDGEHFDVKVIPEADIELPIEIVSIIPPTVSLAKKNLLPSNDMGKSVEIETSGLKIPEVSIREYIEEIKHPPVENIEEAEVQQPKKIKAPEVKFIARSKRKRKLLAQ